MLNDTTFQVIQPLGVLTAGTAQPLVQQVNECLAAKTKAVLIDLQAVDFIDSSGLGILVSLYTKLKLAGSKLFFCAPKEQARILFDIAEINRVFEIFPDRQAFESAFEPLSMISVMEPVIIKLTTQALQP